QADTRARLEQLVRLAALQEGKLKDAEAAFATTALAIRDALAEPELGSLLDDYERLAGAARLPQGAALYPEPGPHVLDEGIKLRLDRFVADAARAEGNAQGAAEYYRRVLDRIPDDDRSLAALEDLYRKADDAASLHDILVRRAELARDAGAEQRLRAEI